MIDTFVQWLHYINDALRIISPFLFFFCTCIWLSLKLRMDKELSRIYMRCYVLEKQIDFVVNNRDVDKEHFRYMANIYKEFGGKMNG